MNIKRHIFELLKRIGLSESEAKFYLAVYQNPKSTVRELQQQCKLSPASAYRAFERLKDLKLITSSPESWRKNVEAVSLHNLAEKLAQEQRKLGKVELELKRLDNLMNLSNQSAMPEPVEVLTDHNQIVEKCYQIVRMPWEHMECYGSAERLIDVIGQSPEIDFINMRIRQGKSCDALLTELGDYTRELIPDNLRDLRNMKLRVDAENQNYATYIYGDEVTIWHTDKEIGNRAIVIKDKALVDIYQNNFRKIWTNS